MSAIGREENKNDTGTATLSRQDKIGKELKHQEKILDKIQDQLGKICNQTERDPSSSAIIPGANADKTVSGGRQTDYAQELEEYQRRLDQMSKQIEELKKPPERKRSDKAATQALAKQLLTKR